MSKTYIVTGGYGFIGSHVIKSIFKKTDGNIVNIDRCSIGSNRENLQNIDNHHQRICTYINDIGDEEWVSYIVKKHKPDYFVHCAAESHVDRSITNPSDFINSNIVGTFNILEAIRKFTPRTRMIHVSTDEVYGHLQRHDQPFLETTPVAPRSPYSASKASSDLLALSYKNTYNLDITVTRCCNNFGPSQYDEKFIPTIIKSIVRGTKIPVYGAGENIREWIYVEDHVNALLEVLHSHNNKDVLNIWGTTSLTNIELIECIITILTQEYPKYKRENFADYYEFVTDRPGHDFKYEISSLYDCIESLSEQRDFHDALTETVKFYAHKYI